MPMPSLLCRNPSRPYRAFLCVRAPSDKPGLCPDELVSNPLEAIPGPRFEAEQGPGQGRN